MTPEQEDLVLSLVGKRLTASEFLEQFGATDGQQLGLSLLRDATVRQDADDVDLALLVAYTFGFVPDHLGTLLELAPAPWHEKHEDVVTALGRMHNPAAVDALYAATQWVPDYLDFDEARALATKAIWSLGGTPGPEAEQALERLLASDSVIVRDGAREQLERRRRR